ncbi:hypothetical protein TOPH_06863 [Tolypocladium ophioglossoides CBS 100239]|uniref:BZIP domain-containing protein n=1 Tax=Tolypocladium ophioglossoides (strain CBS 100239) TaxID=1163406 RepID=A0A0L0N409_TOLOC|nr:hypothetical protein TOPH_06863 [Tolypocladium ophioglossoides CBS 100239]
MSFNDPNGSNNKRPAPQSYGGESSSSQNVEEPRKRRVTGMNNAPDPLFDPPAPAPAPVPATASVPAPAPAPYYGGQLLEPPSSMPAVNTQPSFGRGLRSIAPALLMPYNAQPNILVAGHTLQELGVGIPNWVLPEEVLRRQRCIANEIEYQKNNPPALPPSRIPDLPPKKDIPDYLEFPDGVDEETRRVIEDRNNKIASEAQKIDRERNNMAAKKSRALRIEARDNYRELLIEAKAELKLVRLMLTAHGFDPAMWDHLAPHVRVNLPAQTRGEANAVDARRAELKKREDARKRVERMRARNMLRAQREAAEAAALQQAQALPGAGDGEETLQVVSPDVPTAAVDGNSADYLQVVSPRQEGQGYL